MPELKKFLQTLCSNPVPTVEMLASAIKAERLFLLYQPKVDVKTGMIHGVEALVRMREESGRTIMPDSFIPLAESSGLIDDLTDWVVNAAFQQAKHWRMDGLDLKLAINLSAKNIHDRKLPDIIGAKCHDAGIAPGSVTLELTETASMQSLTMLLEVLGRFRLKGFHLSIDDFGTGYSSVAQLLRLPFSELKIDRSFVSSMAVSRESAIVAKTLIDMARNLGLSTVAEGVETESIFKTLSEWGCDVGQGYLFSRPIEPDAVAQMARRPAWQG